MNREIAVAEKLLQINAVNLNLQNPYTWASGWKSPIYCDNRKILSQPHVRNFIKSELTNCVFAEFPEAEVIAGVATAGIPHGALIADLLSLPFIYVRSKPKGHGMGNQIEGEIPVGKKVVVIEDLISTGKSSMQAIEALQAAGATVIGITSIFNYNFDLAKNLFEEQKIKVVSLSNYNALIQLALDKNIVSIQDMDTLKKWRENPSAWG
ncbi:MAG: orotate phosphoribosyltransferase [Chitinophagaceae bacterium]|nr:MAG: orotate phosphoribosyltransferase [Bacteroidetes bacterium OLB11]MCC6447100.1 orotate phosphoribosyltransferase [Chitinophagaceae bacterium]HMN32056.1 orotate phosphoribosyltransferase [Chitinophagaceae bacterium]